MNTKPEPLSKYVQVDASAARMTRLWTSVSHRLTVKTPPYRRRSVFALVAATGLLLGAAVGYSWVTWWSPTGISRSATVLETASDRLTVELGKRITLQLAANSRVQLLSDNSHVSIRLQYGTITCDLDGPSPRRFSVLVADLEVRDTGTRFSVSRDRTNGQVDVTVERGSVDIIGTAGHHEKSISAGERWTRRGQGASTVASQPSVATQIPSDGETPITPVASSNSNVAVASSATRDEPLSRSAAHDPVESAQVLFERANAARRRGDPGAASQALQTLISRFPNDTRAGLAALELGRLRMGALSDLPGAVRAFQTALARAPSAGFREDALAHLIGAHAALGDTAQRGQLCRRYFAEYPSGVHRALVERKCDNR